jgi:predicted CopG family antitoxin
MLKPKYKMIRVSEDVYCKLKKRKQYPSQSFNSYFSNVFVNKKNKKVKK